MEKSGYRYLAKNVGLVAFSSLITKLLSFFLVPLYTSILTTEEYGIYDFFVTTIGILIPILTLDIQEAIVRFALEKQYSREAIASISSKYVLASNLIVLALLGMNYWLGFSDTINQYWFFFFLLYLAQSVAGIMTNYIRGIEQIADLSISGVLSSCVIIGGNILFLLVFQMGITGYFLANIIGILAQCLYLFIRSGFLGKIRLQRFPEEEKEMTDFSKPLIVNSIAWWITFLSDRYVIVFFRGLTENGIYSMACKLPSLLNLLQSFFTQAWALSAFKDYDAEDEKGFFTNTYRTYNFLLAVSCSGIIWLNKLFSGILFAKDFYAAWRYVPWLTIAVLFTALTGFYGGIFAAVKNSKLPVWSTGAGALANLILNLILTPLYGAMGAAIATLISYALVWAIRARQVRRYVRLRVNYCRDLISYLVLVAQAFICLYMDGYRMYFWNGVLFVALASLYFSEIGMILKKARNRR